MSTSLREAQIRETRAALLEAGRVLFTRQGFDETSTNAIVGGAGLTRGALYHHFATGKLGLFEAVLHELQEEIYSSVLNAGNESDSIIEAQISAYLEGASRPDYRRIVLIEAPAVLGWDAWHSKEANRWMEAMRDGIKALPDGHRLHTLDPEMLASIMFGALGEAALRVASASDPVGAQAKALATFRALIGLE